MHLDRADQLPLCAENQPDRRRFNRPTASEVAAIMPGDGSEPANRRDIVITYRGGGVRRINELNPAYMPLHFPLLFPYGELGWQIGIPHTNPNATTALPVADGPGEHHETNASKAACSWCGAIIACHLSRSPFQAVLEQACLCAWQGWPSRSFIVATCASLLLLTACVCVHGCRRR